MISTAELTSASVFTDAVVVCVLKFQYIRLIQYQENLRFISSPPNSHAYPHEGWLTFVLLNRLRVGNVWVGGLTDRGNPIKLTLVTVTFACIGLLCMTAEALSH